jgi:MscS family membrane protein
MNLNNVWWFEALVGIVALIALQYGINRVISKTEVEARTGWRTQVGKIFKPPLTALIWVMGIFYLMDVIGDRMGFSIAVKYLDALRKTVVVGCCTWSFFRWKREVEHSLLTHPVKKVDLTTVRMVGRLSTIAVGVLSGLITLQIFGVNTAPLLAFGSIGAAALGFAGKDVMANFCSGIMLYMTRPFVIGDQIYLPDKNLEGHVEEIGWFRTSLRDKDKRAVYLPNNFFSTMLLVNISRMTHRHIKQQMKISFKDMGKISEVVDAMRLYLEKCPEIDTEYPLHVFLKSFGDYACEIEIEAYSNVLDQDAFNRLQHRILLELQAILGAMDVRWAIPTMQWVEQPY